MNKLNKDLFDDSTMSFGEHLEALRTHLIRALLGLVVTVVICLYQGEKLVSFVQAPIQAALKEYAKPKAERATLSMYERFKQDWGVNIIERYYVGMVDWFAGRKSEDQIKEEQKIANPNLIMVQVQATQLYDALHQANPDQFGALTEEQQANSTLVPLGIQSERFAQYNETTDQMNRPVTFNVQEAFMTYLKVSVISGFLLASPWIFYQLWLFVAAGLYKHEQKYVYVYGSMSLGLFLLGAMFCFFMVFPVVLNFLLTFNRAIETHPQIRLNEWVTFAVTLPIVFGISFQLPLVMLFLERIAIVNVKLFQEQRRMAILIIAIISAVLTPADPLSMSMMLGALVMLYELGIRLCVWLPKEGFNAEDPLNTLASH